MDYALGFIEMFLLGLVYAGPILLFLILLIVALGQLVGRREKWSRIDALYFSFITATTVGYGDFRPSSRQGKFLSILIALIGLIFTGIIVAIGVKALTVAFSEIYAVSLQ